VSPIASCLVAVLVAAALPAPAAAPDLPAPELTREQRNKAVAMRVFTEILSQGHFEVASEIYAPDFKNHGLHRDADLKTDQDAARSERRAFPDLVVTPEMLVAEGDLVTALWTFRGTHSAGGYGGLPATGARIEMRGMTIWRIVDGKIHDEWTTFNELKALSQVVAHVRWQLAAIAAALLLAVVAAERALWWAGRRLYQGRKGA
jgi:steroid delta-isomerase-like uncharacterized protein